MRLDHLNLLNTIMSILLKKINKDMPIVILRINKKGNYKHIVIKWRILYKPHHINLISGNLISVSKK